MADEYSLKWNKHQKTVVNCLSALRQTCSFVDVTLHTSDGHTFSAHKVVLSACSSFFEGIFKVHPTDKIAVFLKDISHMDLRFIMEFVYSGEISVSRSSLPSLLDAAEALGIKGLCRSPDEYEQPMNIVEKTAIDPSPKKKRFKLDQKIEASLIDEVPTNLLSVSPCVMEGSVRTETPSVKSEFPDGAIGVPEDNEAVSQKGAGSDGSEESMHADAGELSLEVYENEGFSNDFKCDFGLNPDEPVSAPPSQILSALLRRPTGNEIKNDDPELDPDEVAMPLPNGEIRCRECERNFENMYKFKRHVKSTHGGRNFQCKFCNRKFKLRHHVRDHMIRSHSVIE